MCFYEHDVVMPNVENKFLEEKRESFLKYISSKTVVFSKNTALLSARLDKLFEKAHTAFKELSETVNQYLIFHQY